MFASYSFLALLELGFLFSEAHFTHTPASLALFIIQRKKLPLINVQLICMTARNNIFLWLNIPATGRTMESDSVALAWVELLLSRRGKSQQKEKLSNFLFYIITEAPKNKLWCTLNYPRSRKRDDEGGKTPKIYSRSERGENFPLIPDILNLITFSFFPPSDVLSTSSSYTSLMRK